MSQWKVLALSIFISMSYGTHANALALWRGAVKVVATSGQCANGFEFFVAGEEKNVFFVPAGMDNNGPNSVLNVGSDAYFVSTKVVGAAIATGAAHQSTAIDPFGNQTASSGTFQIGTITPASFTPATKQLSVVFRLTNAGGRQGCTVTLRGHLHRFVAN